MGRNGYVCLLAFLFLLALSGCVESGFDSSSESSESSELSTYYANLKAVLIADGLSEAEASAIIEAAEEESSSASLSLQNHFHSQSYVSSEVLSRLPVIVKGAMNALGSSSFSNDSRRLLAVELISSKIYEIASEDLIGLSESELSDLVGDVVKAQMAAFGNSGISSGSQNNALSSMVEKSLSGLENAGLESNYKKGVTKSLAGAAIGALAGTGLSAGEIASVTPKIVSGASRSVLSMKNKTAAEKAEIIVEFIAETLIALPLLNLSGTDVDNVEADLSTEVSNVISSDDTLSTDDLDAITSSVSGSMDEPLGCSDRPQWVYIYEYADEHCQTVTNQYVEGPMNGSSPMLRGFPQIGFCVASEETNGVYYNWIGGDTGCTAPEPSVGSMPSPPTPTIAASVYAVSSAPNSCFFKFHTGALGSSAQTDRDLCEGTAMDNFFNNWPNIGVKSYSNYNVVLVLDTSLYTSNPDYERYCWSKTVPDNDDFNDRYVGSKAECLEYCDKIFPNFQYDFNCMYQASNTASQESLKEYRVTTPTTATVNIYNWSKTTSEGLNSSFLIQLQNAVSTDTVMSYTTVDGTATAGSDYIAKNGTFTLSAGSTNKFIYVPLIDDVLTEPDETFDISLSIPSGFTLDTQESMIIPASD